MFNKKSVVILFIDRNRLQFYGANLSGVQALDIPEVYIRDLDVVNRDGLYTFIKQWVKQHELVGVQLVFVFSETSYFEKIFTSHDPAELETEIIKFFDSVPFESSITKVYEATSGKRAVAINKALYEAIRQGFLLQGVSTKGVIVASQLVALANKRTLDAEMGEFVLKNIDMLLRQSVVDSQDLTKTISASATSQPQTIKKKSSLPLLLGVFGLLLLVLVVMIISFG